MARIAYGILCHQSARYTLEQFELLFAPGASFYYHIDLKAPKDLSELACRLALNYSNVHVLPSTLCAWGGFSLTSVMVDLIQAALRHASWDHLIFLSEQHLPLQSYRTISDSISLNHDYIELRRFGSLNSDGQSDIRSRYARKHVELSGVGSFGTTKCSPEESFFDKLYHGSQWMTLSRRTCEQIPSSDADYFQPYRHSVLSDENALQTWIGQTNDDGVVHECRSLTFVAGPSRGGSPDMIFDDRIFLMARDSGHLFIRKRPAVLSDLVSQCYADMLPLTERKSEGTACGNVGRWGLAPELIRGWFNCMAVKGTQFATMPANVYGPSFFCSASHGDLRYPFGVYVLSEDLHNFKIIAVHHQAFSTFDDAMVGPYSTSVIRMRAHDLSFYREIHLGADYNEGYYQVGGIADLVGLVNVVNVFVTRTLELVAKFVLPTAPSEVTKVQVTP